ncbi:NAD-dependent deacetylase (regulatory protein Sir homolog) [Citrobacter koseri]|uniref:NAD-dependent deacetylase (Regulatory protein Sir homolog) n=1 Tax=Citrobacter koseri TaxID=545 RepID=A0A2X2WWJ1_CITKO|nr:NAD-dependent deacetylase (regulatory protein Sir homolog) [Citrobacter koseri]
MQSRRAHRLSRFRKNKRHLRERLRQRIFFQRQSGAGNDGKTKSISSYWSGNLCRIRHSYISRR